MKSPLLPGALLLSALLLLLPAAAPARADPPNLLLNPSFSSTKPPTISIPACSGR